MVHCVLLAQCSPGPMRVLSVFMAARVVMAKALMWCPFPLPALLVLVALPILGGMVTGAAHGHVLRVSPALLAAVSAALIPAAYLVAVGGGARGRGGDAPLRHLTIFHPPGIRHEARPPGDPSAHALLRPHLR